MTRTFKAICAAIIGVGALGFATANAKPHDKEKSSHSNVEKKHGSHSAGHYDDYRYDRDSGVSFTITVGNDRYGDYRHSRYDRGRYDHRRYDDRRRGYRGHRGYRSRVVNREVYNTRYRARIVLLEEVVRTRRGPRLFCTVSVRGPDANYVSERRVRRIARRDCSHDARIRVNT